MEAGHSSSRRKYCLFEGRQMFVSNWTYMNYDVHEINISNECCKKKFWKGLVGKKDGNDYLHHEVFFLIPLLARINISPTFSETKYHSRFFYTVIMGSCCMRVNWMMKTWSEDDLTESNVVWTHSTNIQLSLTSIRPVQEMIRSSRGSLLFVSTVI